MNESDYRPQFTIDEWGREQLLLCEAEWLARPEAWGFDVLADRIRERKERLYRAHYFRFALDLVGWPFAGQIKALLREDDFVPPRDSLNAIAEIEIQTASAAVLSDEVFQFFRYLRLYCRNVVTATEMWNRTFECLLRAGGGMDFSVWARKHLDPVSRSLSLDIIGNPFRPITIDPRWLTSNVVDLARVIYDERAFEKMPILADALMDAGCDSEEIINHCRGDGPHVRGCWVVDLILGKS